MTKTWTSSLGTALLLGIALFASIPAQAQAQTQPQASFDLGALTALLAERKSAEVRFTEERYVSGFDSPLRASGTLSFTAPDRFARRTLEPQVESMVVEGNTVSIKRGGRSRQMALDAVPELTALIEAVRSTLNGDAATLQRHFNARVEGRPSLWTLTLTPRDARLAAQVRELQIAGQGSDLRSVALWLAGGDRSVMSIDRPSIDRPSLDAPPRSAPAAPR